MGMPRQLVCFSKRDKSKSIGKKKGKNLSSLFLSIIGPTLLEYNLDSKRSLHFTGHNSNIMMVHSN